MVLLPRGLTTTFVIRLLPVFCLTSLVLNPVLIYPITFHCFVLFVLIFLIVVRPLPMIHLLLQLKLALPGMLYLRNMLLLIAACCLLVFLHSLIVFVTVVTLVAHSIMPFWMGFVNSSPTVSTIQP